MSAEPEVQPSAAPLQFDRAVHVDPSAAPTLLCTRCTQSIALAYYHEGDRTLCAGCGKVRQHMTSPDRSTGTLARAAVFGAGAAIVGALLYYGVMAYLELEIGIVAIAIGWLVGRAVATATRGRSSRRHRMMALGLTYLSVSLAYAPFAVKEMKGRAKTAKVTADSAGTTTPATAFPALAASTPAAAIGAAPAARGKDGKTPTAGGLAVALLVVTGLLLFLPVMAALGSMPSGLLSILIIGFGMRQAWRMAGASNAVVTGPHAIGRAAA